MLTKDRSKRILRYKYFLLLPLVLGMLVYSSCDRESKTLENKGSVDDTVHLEVGDLSGLSEPEELEKTRLIEEFKRSNKSGLFMITDSFGQSVEIRVKEGEISTIDVRKGKNKHMGYPFGKIEQVPVFPGCEDTSDKAACFNEMMQNHIFKNFRYPEEAQEKGIQGRVAVMFTIDDQGNVVNIQKRGPDPTLEAEAGRIISKLPKMQPGKNEGKPVDVIYSIPINFKLQ